MTGSKYLVQAGHASALVDCGLFQGYKSLRLRNWAPFPGDLAHLDAIVLTHAHLDHSGYLPLAVRNGFPGPVYCTEATRELCRVLLLDSAHLQEEQAEEANRFGWSKHAPALPLYTRADALAALERLRPLEFDREFEPAPGLRARFVPAGHILGAASLVLECQGRTLAFSGDLGRTNDALMRPPRPLEKADLLVVESTYGNRLHDASDSVAALGRIVARVAAQGGTVVVPSFAVGRAQLLLLHLHRLMRYAEIPPSLPIYLDSPMAAEVTQIYMRFPREHRLSEMQMGAFAKGIRVVASPEESRALDQSPWPKVILAGSGMATGGRVLHHIKRYGTDPRSAIVFAGFQAPGTRGEALVNGASEVKIHGQEVRIRAQVHQFENFSAHADQEELMQWLRAFRQAPAQLYLTHGEPAAAEALRKRIARDLRWHAQVPEHLAVASLPLGSEAPHPASLPP